MSNKDLENIETNAGIYAVNVGVFDWAGNEKIKDDESSHWHQGENYKGLKNYF